MGLLELTAISRIKQHTIKTDSRGGGRSLGGGRSGGRGCGRGVAVATAAAWVAASRGCGGCSEAHVGHFLKSYDI